MDIALVVRVTRTISDNFSLASGPNTITLCKISVQISAISAIFFFLEREGERDVIIAASLPPLSFPSSFLFLHFSHFVFHFSGNKKGECPFNGFLPFLFKYDRHA